MQKHRSPETYEWYRLPRFLDHHPRMDALNLKPHHVQKWADSYQLSVTSNRNYRRSVKTSLAWTVKEGYLDSSPIEHLEVPAAEHKDV